MIISQNGLITLHYDPAADILSVELPDIRRFTVGDVERALKAVVEEVPAYDIKKMLLDSSRAVIEVEDEEYRKVVMRFALDLTKTRLKKLARIGSPDARQEQRASATAQEIRRTVDLPVEYQNFPTKAEAKQWLQAKP